MNRILNALLLSAASFLLQCKPQEKKPQEFVTVANMDKGVNPGDNFYNYVNGEWLKTAVIPSTESGVGSFIDLQNKTRKNLNNLLEELANMKDAKGMEQLIGDFYASGLDSLTIEKRGYEPLKPVLEKINALQNTEDVKNFIISQFNEANGFLYGFYVGADDKNSRMNIVNFYQSGLGLPDRDFYFKTDSISVSIQDAYRNYMAKLFTLTGENADYASKAAQTIYAFEKELAQSHLKNEDLRDPEKNYNKFAVAVLDKKYPNFAWEKTLSAMGAKTDSVNVSQPKYYEKLNEVFKSAPLDAWKAYLKFHEISRSANALSHDFVQASFDYNKIFSGQEKLKPRWQRIAASTSANLGEALGQVYVKKYFTEESKNRMIELVNNLEAAFEKRIQNLDWMSPETKEKAIDKLHSFAKKIGFPDQWKDYASVKTSRDAYFENLASCDKYEHQRMMDKIGKPVDRSEWGMTPQTINAYYHPTNNEIVFPAGILQFPFFDKDADDAINYGGIGMVIGHEMTHGFDDQGSQYDKNGNLKNWWGEEDKTKFQEKVKQIISLYSSYTVLDTVHVNGKLTTGENMADFGGVAIAYDAFKLTKQGQDTVKIDGFTPDQRFFISTAQIWQSKKKPESVRTQVNTDPHSPAEWRVLGPLTNFTPFYQAFAIKENSKLFVPEDKRLKIW